MSRVKVLDITSQTLKALQYFHAGCADIWYSVTHDAPNAVSLMDKGREWNTERLPLQSEGGGHDIIRKANSHQKIFHSLPYHGIFVITENLMLSDLTDKIKNKNYNPLPFQKSVKVLSNLSSSTIQYCGRKVCDSTDGKDNRKVHFAPLPIHIHSLLEWMPSSTEHSAGVRGMNTWPLSDCAEMHKRPYALWLQRETTTIIISTN